MGLPARGEAIGAPGGSATGDADSAAYPARGTVRDIFVRYMNDAAFQKLVTSWMAEPAYRRMRADAQPAFGPVTTG